MSRSGVVAATATLLLGLLVGGTAQGAPVSPKADASSMKVASVTVNFGSAGADVAWRLSGSVTGLTTLVRVHLEGYEPFQATPRANRRSVQVQMKDLMSVAASPSTPTRTLSAQVTLVDQAGRVVATKSSTRALSQLASPQGVTAEPASLAYRVKWSSQGLDRKLVAQVVEWDLVRGTQSVVRSGMAYRGQIEVPVNRFNPRLVQVQFVATNALSSAWPSSPITVTPKDPVGGDVTPPAPPCCLNWAPGPGTLTVSWNPAEHPRAVGFLITYGTSPNNVAVARVPISAATSYTITGLQPKTRYTVTVSSWDSAGNVSQPSKAQEYTTD